MTRLGRFLCFIGLHAWPKTKIPLFMIFPAPGQYMEIQRSCQRCELTQRWLPGYGGSEIGCWLTIRKRK